MKAVFNHPASKMPHNIDLHAVTGPGGGAASSFTAPGHETIFLFTTINSELFVYHCATAPVGMQGDYYTKGKCGEQGTQLFSMCPLTVAKLKKIESDLAGWPHS